MEALEQLTYTTIGCAYKVHSFLGPGLLESAYEVSLEYELRNAGLSVARQKAIPLVYQEIKLDAGYRIDLLVNNILLLEIKSVDAVAPVHRAQVLTYLKLSGFNLGLILNFNVCNMQEGVHRVILSKSGMTRKDNLRKS
jgi:GxxExxY protein